MKYTYVYKSSDGVRHEASLEANSREAVFASLRRQGIKPIKVMAADGSKANGEIRGVRKRIVTVLVLLVALMAGILGALISAKQSARATQSNQRPRAHATHAQPLPRQMIPGDRQRLMQAMASFTNAAERTLVAFAEPGRPGPKYAMPPEAAFRSILSTPLVITDNEFTESIDLKRIVMGLKREMRAYLAGGGTLSNYLAECVKRQNQEIAYRVHAETRLKQLLKDVPAAYAYWLKANAQLQSMGIYPLPLPDTLRSYQLSLDLDE